MMLGFASPAWHHEHSSSPMRPEQYVAIGLMVVTALGPFGIWLAQSRFWDTAERVFSRMTIVALVGAVVLELVAVLRP